MTGDDLKESFEFCGELKPLKKGRSAKHTADALSREMYSQFHESFQHMKEAVPAISYYIVDYPSGAAPDQTTTIKFIMFKDNRPFSIEIANVRTQMENFLGWLVDNDSSKNMKLQIKGYNDEFVLHCRPRELFAVYDKLLHHGFQAHPKFMGPLHMAGHLLDRPENFAPASQLN